jgi:hypothetical protein
MFKSNSKNTIIFFSTFKMVKTMFGIHKFITKKNHMVSFHKKKKSYERNWVMYKQSE